ncbi:uncharacterized protein LOC128672602 [Plodia interpunctella]|uniref:uncharacterized protein LOC128672602 n=1 Tax=Plodia interpunctella TaxID=58824 RepID=UPI002368CEA6|nr:uncharacterized protein LOC128672602 [Plodia interpunctella]
MAHDSELVLFCGIIRMILARVCIIRAHVEKKYGEKDGTKLNKVDALTNKTQLDIMSMHRTYELLHKCAEQLNSIISLPMMILLFCSGLTTTMLLRDVFIVVQSDDIDQTLKLTIILFCIVRCGRYTLMVIIPCYCSTVTTTRVARIRTILHDAVNSGRLDKIEKRQVKAFFYLTREKEFAYAIWGVIRLNMSLPLSYFSLCTTYLVIIIQFSKFID